MHVFLVEDKVSELQLLVHLRMRRLTLVSCLYLLLPEGPLDRLGGADEMLVATGLRGWTESDILDGGLHLPIGGGISVSEGLFIVLLLKNLHFKHRNQILLFSFFQVIG